MDDEYGIAAFVLPYVARAGSLFNKREFLARDMVWSKPISECLSASSYVQVRHRHDMKRHEAGRSKGNVHSQGYGLQL